MIKFMIPVFCLSLIFGCSPKVVKDAEAVVEDSVVLAEDVAKDEANA
jgi:hypothetical protein